MIWNHDMSAAPKGQTVQRMVTTTQGDKSYEAFEPDYVILASKCGKVGKSYWLPMEDRWAGFQPGEEVRAWMPWPTHPDQESPRKAAEADSERNRARPPVWVDPDEPEAAAEVAGDYLREPVAAGQGQIIQEGDAPRETGRFGGDASSLDTHSPDMALETMGGTGDDCSFGNRGVWPPQGGASSSHGNDSLSVVTAGETATHFITDDCGSGA